MIYYSKFLTLLVIVSCGLNEKKSNSLIGQSSSSRVNSVISLAGDTLAPKSFPDSVYQVLLKNMTDAQALSSEYPDSVELAIWHGRRVAYMARYHEAIEVFSAAIEKFPNDHRLYRHRGHRYLTTRQFDKAIADFEKAAILAEGQPMRLEPDGIPNKINQPLSNDHFNIYYHLGLAYYLKKDFVRALQAYNKCMEVSNNPDLVIATAYWRYMTLCRLGQREHAAAFLRMINTNIILIENDAYLELLRLFKGQVGEQSIAMHPTNQYGVGMKYWTEGDRKKAEGIWNDVLSHRSWDSFGYIAAEAERNSLQ